MSRIDSISKKLSCQVLFEKIKYIPTIIPINPRNNKVIL